MIDSVPVGRLPHLGALRFVGPDVATFLQGQVSNDTRLLDAHRAVLAAYSTPQGRVVSLLLLVPHSGGVLAILPADLVAPTLDRLRKFVLRAKVKIEAAEGVVLCGAMDATALHQHGLVGPAEPGGYLEAEGIGIVRAGRYDSRYYVLGAPERLALQGLSPLGVIEDSWRLADIRSGMPQVYAATSEAFVAQMLNLDLLDGISFSKGCYTGQEIIARTQHLGRIKRRMFRLQLPPGEWQIGSSLSLRDGRSGRLTEVMTSSAGIEALAVLTLEGQADSADATVAHATVAATQLPLPYSI